LPRVRVFPWYSGGELIFSLDVAANTSRRCHYEKPFASRLRVRGLAGTVRSATKPWHVQAPANWGHEAVRRCGRPLVRSRAFGSVSRRSSKLGMATVSVARVGHIDVALDVLGRGMAGQLHGVLHLGCRRYIIRGCHASFLPGADTESAPGARRKASPKRASALVGAPVWSKCRASVPKQWRDRKRRAAPARRNG
jgi:hypothetical protein